MLRCKQGPSFYPKYSLKMHYPAFGWTNSLEQALQKWLTWGSKSVPTKDSDSMNTFVG